MTAEPPPILSLSIPVLGWYTVESGGIQASQFLSIPNAGFLSSPDGLNPGFVGTQDGALIHLAGTLVTGDGGQTDLMWVANSLAVPDGFTVFNPWPLLSTPGRWIAPPTVAPNMRLVVAGAVIQLSATVIYVVVRKTVPSVTTLLLPTMAASSSRYGEKLWVKADMTTRQYPITVTTTDGTLIDGQVSDVINQNEAERSYTPDGTQWNKG